MLTSCESPSVFVVKGKFHPFKLFQADEGFMKTMQTVGQVFEVSEELLAGCKKFVCALNGHKSNDVNAIRYILISLKGGDSLRYSSSSGQQIIRPRCGIGA